MGVIPRSGAAPDDKSVRELVPELFSLVVRYAKQETLDPVKSLGRFVLWGVAGAIALAVGVVLLALAIVRVLQTELAVHLSGSLSWVPYTGGLLFVLAVAALAVSRIGKVPR